MKYGKTVALVKQLSQSSHGIVYIPSEREKQRIIEVARMLKITLPELKVLR